MDIPYTHRACAMITNENELFLEDEDLSAIPHPKQRFTRPVRVALFIFGMAPEDEDDVPVHELQQGDELKTAELSKSQFNTEIWFEGARVPREVQSSVARLHCNLGHPQKAELIRILAASGGLSSGMLNAIEALRCGSCIRLGKPAKPPTSSTTSIKHAGFFGDHLQTDIIYVRVLTGKAITVLGVCCINTNFHAALVVSDRQPSTILRALQEAWYRPYMDYPCQ